MVKEKLPIKCGYFVLSNDGIWTYASNNLLQKGYANYKKPVKPLYDIKRCVFFQIVEDAYMFMANDRGDLYGGQYLYDECNKTLKDRRKIMSKIRKLYKIVATYHCDHGYTYVTAIHK